MNWLKTIGWWLERRLQFRDSLLPLLRHPVPSALSKPVGWFYVFGSITLTFFVIQIVTGLILAMVYVPSAGEAYASLQYLNDEVPAGWLLRAIHNWSATGMVVMLCVHMTQVFLMGAFKYPREATWMAGVLLLGLTLTLGFSGQVLRWDGDAYWGVGVAAAALGRIPWLGPPLVHILLGGPFMGTETVSRFFSLHVFVLPGLLIAVVTLHLYLVVKRGISEPPEPGQGVDPQSYDKKYERILENGEPFFPHALYRDGLACGAAVLVIMLIAFVFGPKGPGDPPDPTLIHVEPRPDWYFLAFFALLALSPPALEAYIMLAVPILLFVGLILVPLVAGKGERSARRRPVAVLSVVGIYTVFIVLSWVGYTTPWSPHMTAWKSDPVPQDIVERLTPLELQGAVLFQNKTCRNCHALEGVGGRRGPDLTYVGTRMNPEAMIRQVVQGGGNMPSFGKELTSDEVDALVAFLVALHPKQHTEPRVPVVTEQ